MGDRPTDGIFCTDIVSSINITTDERIATCKIFSPRDFRRLCFGAVISSTNPFSISNISSVPDETDEYLNEFIKKHVFPKEQLLINGKPFAHVSILQLGTAVNWKDFHQSFCIKSSRNNFQFVNIFGVSVYYGNKGYTDNLKQFTTFQNHFVTGNMYLFNKFLAGLKLIK